MINQMRSPTRRHLLAGLMASAGLLAMPAWAQTSTLNGMDPWKPRKLKSREKIYLSDAGKAVGRELAKMHHVQEKFLDTHYRIRLPVTGLFEGDRFDLTADGVASLTLMSAALLTYSDVLVEAVVHHRPYKGNYDPHIISERRAQAIIGALASRSVPMQRMRGTGMGSRFPLVDQMSPDARKINERVEFLLFMA